MTVQNKKIIKWRIKYHLLKIAPYGSKIKIDLINGLKYILRSKTLDKAILKEVWIRKIYDQFGIKVEEGDTVIDIGAHVGIFSIYAAELSKSGKVYAFEPFLENFSMLQKHKTLNNKTNLLIYNLGVTGTKGKRILNLSTDNNTGGHSLHLKSNSENKIEIETIILSEFCNQMEIDKIDFLKLDCEGAEFEILMAEQSLLDRVQKVILECHPFENNTVSSMIKLLENKGFKVYKETNVTHENIQMLYGTKTFANKT